MRANTSIKDKIEYGYLSGVAAMREQKLLGRVQLERLLDASDFREKLKVLADTVYGEPLSEALTVEDVEEALDGYLGSIFESFRKDGLPAEFNNMLRLKYDLINIAVAMKKYFLDEEQAASNKIAFHSAGDYFKWLSGGIDSQELAFGGLNGQLEEMREEILRQGPMDEQGIRRLTGSWQWKLELASAKKLGSKNIYDFVRIKIDIANLKTVFRRAMLGLKPETSFIEGGFIETKELIEYSRKEKADIVPALLTAGYEFLKDFSVTEKASIPTFDRESERELQRRLSGMKYQTDGCEQLYRYFYNLEKEIFRIRTILMGSLCRLEEESVGQRVLVDYERH